MACQYFISTTWKQLGDIVLKWVSEWVSEFIWETYSYMEKCTHDGDISFMDVGLWCYGSEFILNVN